MTDAANVQTRYLLSDRETCSGSRKQRTCQWYFLNVGKEELYVNSASANVEPLNGLIKEIRIALKLQSSEMSFKGIR